MCTSREKRIYITLHACESSTSSACHICMRMRKLISRVYDRLRAIMQSSLMRFFARKEKEKLGKRVRYQSSFFLI